ncbi:MAG: hypothetical protein JO144_07695 [Actinobacteria bacterium]|nr:hypothetical protein [Actinomycetota bacterium]
MSGHAWNLFPFSAGPARCPGRDLVLLTGAVVLAELLHRRLPVKVGGQRLGADSPLPATLDHTALRLRLDPPRPGRQRTA